MKLKYFGHSCFSLRFEGGPALITDPFDESVGYPLCTEACDAALVSHDHFDHNHTRSLTAPFETICAAGDYEIRGARIRAMESFHDEKRGALRGKNLLFRVECEGLSVAHLGDLGCELTENQKEVLKGLDALLIPVGGFYTIDAAQAAKMAKDLSPRTVIPMHYHSEHFGFDVIGTVEEFTERMQGEKQYLDSEVLVSNSCMPAVTILRPKNVQ